MLKVFKDYVMGLRPVSNILKDVLAMSVIDFCVLKIRMIQSLLRKWSYDQNTRCLVVGEIKAFWDFGSGIGVTKYRQDEIS